MNCFAGPSPRHAHASPLLVLLLLGHASGCRKSTGVHQEEGGRIGNVIASTPMQVARALHTSTRLIDGRILLIGGGTPEVPIANAELFDPVARTSRVIPMTRGRLGHTATLLDDGRVLVVGGGYGLGGASARGAELFDPATDSFRPTGSPTEARADHAAVRLVSGSVLILGGDVSGVGNSPTASAELYDPKTERFTLAGSMITARRPYGVVALANGSVLIAGGTSTDKRIVAASEIFDSKAGQFVPVGNLRVAREKHAAALLPDGRVIVAGGSVGPSDADRLAGTELFDPRTSEFSDGPMMHLRRHKISAASLPDGAVLFVGGGSDLAELFAPARNRFVRIAGAAGLERFYPAATALGDGSVFISGGYTRGGSKREAWVVRP